MAAACFFPSSYQKQKISHSPKILIAKDTRLSSDMLESALAAGITSMGVDAILCGCLPTPGAAFLTRSMHANGGIVISASHNPANDNGIKFFNAQGGKLEDNQENLIEELLDNEAKFDHRPCGTSTGKILHLPDAIGRYCEFAKSSFPRHLSLEGIHIAVDCANGAASQSTPAILKELGATLTVINSSPDGRNINKNCGSTHPQAIQKLVLDCQAHLGIAHDGDADRCLLCDEKGAILDGDDILAIAGINLLHAGKLAKNTIVATVMSNFALDEFFASHNAHVIRTPVGDRHIIAQLESDQLNLGGEQSGHIVFRDFTTTGDGIITALQILRIIAETGEPLSKLKSLLQKFPQAHRNIKVTHKPPIESLGNVCRLLDQLQSQLAGRGRTLLRYSGTEPKIRLLIEGPDRSLIENWADEIAAAIQSAIGAPD